MKFRLFRFSGHAIQRMFERSISKPDVIAVIESGEAIADYPSETPYPACLLLGTVESRVLHVVIGMDRATETCHVITAYPPNPALWSSDFRTRKRP